MKAHGDRRDFGEKGSAAYSGSSGQKFRPGCSRAAVELEGDKWWFLAVSARYKKMGEWEYKSAGVYGLLSDISLLKLRREVSLEKPLQIR